MAHRKVFVYGTLRPGDANWASDGFVADPVPGTTHGTLYDHGGFPYADFDGTDTIQGDVITLDDEQRTFHMVRNTEVNAGYVEREVIVETAAGPVVAVAYDAGSYVRQYVLPNLRVIESGDWLVVTKRRYALD